MKVLEIKEDCEIKSGEKTFIQFKRDKFYIMSDDLYGKVNLLLGNMVGVEIPFKEIYTPYNKQDLSQKKVLAIRHGGGGDILFLSTAFKNLKRTFPSVKISIATSEQYFPLLNQEKEFDIILSLPIELSKWNEYHYHFIFENLIENNPDAREINAYDLFLKQVGIPPKTILPSLKIPKITLSTKMKEKVEKNFISLKSDKKKVGIQVASSTPIRNYPAYNFVSICNSLIAKGYEVFLFGSSIQKNEIDYIYKAVGDNITKVIFPLKNAIAICSFMDMFIAPDSMFIHIAGAFRIPVVGIYGPFHSSLRMKYLRNSIGIDVKTACSPCFKHGGFPCPKGNPSPCLNSIVPEVIIQAFEAIEKK